MTFFCYILECADKSFYTGFTKDIIRRLRAHNAGRGGRYTRGRCPVELKYLEVITTKRDALRREADIKRLSHNDKAKLILNRGISVMLEC